VPPTATPYPPIILVTPTALPGDAPPPALTDTPPGEVVPGATVAPPTSAPVTHTVQAGDTLLGLAMQYGVPMAAIQLQNNMGSSQTVRVGQTLEIPPAAAWQGASPFWIVHIVSAGETLSGIAQRYGVTLPDLRAANGLTDADMITVGQPLVIPLRNYTEARPAAEPLVPTPAPTQVSVAAATPRPTVAPVTIAPAPPPADAADWPYETARIINEVRAAHGLPPLVYNELLAVAAQAQANDCMQRGWCSHTGSDGSDIKVRVLRTGYQPSSWAECWAQRLTPQGAVDIWMDEIPPNDPHRRTLLTTWLSDIGVGVVKTSWGYYFIAVFGKPLN